MEPPCPRVDHPGYVRRRLPRGGGSLEQRIGLSGRWGGVGRPGRPFHARTWAPTWLFGLDSPPDYRSDRVRQHLPRRGGGGGGRSSFSLRSTDLRGRRTGRAPISRAYLGADYYFWLLDLDTACSHGPRLPHGSGDPLSDLVVEATARVCGAIRLWGGARRRRRVRRGAHPAVPIVRVRVRPRQRDQQ